MDKIFSHAREGRQIQGTTFVEVSIIWLNQTERNSNRLLVAGRYAGGRDVDISCAETEGVVIEEYNGEGVLARTTIYTGYASRQKSNWISDHTDCGRKLPSCLRYLSRSLKPSRILPTSHEVLGASVRE
jgi:hypothetical protein